MRKLLNRYTLLKHNKSFYLLLAGGVLLFVVSLIFNYYANIYTANHISSQVSDLILDRIPAFDVEIVFFEGFLTFLGAVILLALRKPKRLPFLLNATAMFLIVRSFFMILTHLAPPLHQDIFVAQNWIEKGLGGSGDDLFFSGHTGYPFLWALIFWENKYLRYFFLAATLLFGCTVLMGHLHYSIDVFSALFITYGIYKMSIKIFKKSHNLSLEESKA